MQQRTDTTFNHMPAKITIARAVKRLRLQSGFSTQEAAKAAGIRPNTWNDIERGQANPRLSTLEAIAYTLGVETSAFFQPENTQP